MGSSKGTAAPAKPETATEANLGTFALDKETENMRRFAQPQAEGRDLLQYVSKETLAALGNPESIEVIVRIPA